MAFFNIQEINERAEAIRNADKSNIRKIRIAFCGNCQQDQEHIYLFYHDVPDEYVGSRICMVCGFAPGKNRGVTNKKLRAAVLAADHYECVYCGATDRLAIDHVVPHCRGGKTVFENLLTACWSCNSSRNTKRTPILRFGRFRKQR